MIKKFFRTSHADSGDRSPLLVKFIIKITLAREKERGRARVVEDEARLESKKENERSITRVEKILNSLSCVRYAIGPTFRISRRFKFTDR